MVILSGCTSAPPPSQPPISLTPGPDSTGIAEPTDCRQRILAVSLDNEATVDALDECRFVAVGVIAAQEVIAAGGTRDQLWAAVWIYSSAGADPAPLAPLLTNPDPSVRAMAAVAAVCWGDPRGFAVLSESLSDAGPLAGARPPVAIRRFAAYALGRCIGQDGTPAPA